MRDLMGALRTLALAESTITDLVTDDDGTVHVYVNAIPRSVIEAADTRRPPKMLVIRMAGGSGKVDVLPVFDRRVDAVCYGETDFEANRVLRAVTNVFTLLDRETHSSVLIHWINPSGGPIPSVEPDLVWPVVAQSFTTKADLLEVA